MAAAYTHEIAPIIDDLRILPPPPLPPFRPIVTVPLYAGGVPALAMVQSHAATRHNRVAVIALMPVEFVIGPVTRTNPADAGLSEIAGATELAFTAPLHSSCPVELFIAPSAVTDTVPPFTEPFSVTVPLELLRTPYAVAALPPVTAPATVTEPAPDNVIPVIVDADPPVTVPDTVRDPVETVTPPPVVPVTLTQDPVPAPSTNPTPVPDAGPDTFPVTVTVAVEALFTPFAEALEPPTTEPTLTVAAPEIVTP